MARRQKGTAAMEKLVSRVYHAQVKAAGPLGGFENARKTPVPVYVPALDEDLAVTLSGHDERGPFLKLDGFGTVRKAEAVRLRSALFRGT